MNALLRESSENSDAWVKEIAELLQTLPEAGNFNLEGSADGLLRTLAKTCKSTNHLHSHLFGLLSLFTDHETHDYLLIGLSCDACRYT